jgi:hypothetical protein
LRTVPKTRHPHGPAYRAVATQPFLWTEQE